MSLLLHLLDDPPSDLPAANLTSLRKEIERGAASVLSGEKEQSAFMLYLLGGTYSEVAEQTGWPLNTVILTSLKHKWYDKKQIVAGIDSKDAARHVLKSIVNSMLATTAAVIAKQMQQVIRGELTLNECKFIPKDIYGLEKFISVVNQIHKLTEKIDNIQNINVNVANLAGGSRVNVSGEEQPKALQSLTLDEYNSMSREDRLKILTKQTAVPSVKES